MPGLNVDFNQWPSWLLFLLIVINIFKAQIAAAIPDTVKNWFQFRVNRQADREEFQQEMAEVQLNSRLQSEAADQLRKSWREEQWVELLQQMLSWMREDLGKDITEIRAGQDKQMETLTQVQRNTLRTNDLLTTIHITLSKLAERRGGNGEG